MKDLHFKLLSDITLFSLNDKKTTKFYTKNINYFIKYFIFFKDIDIITDYFVAGNTKFTAKFKKELQNFLKIIEYADTEDNKEANNMKDIKHKISYLFPSDDESHTGEYSGHVLDEAVNSFSDDNTWSMCDDDRLEYNNSEYNNVIDSISVFSLGASSSCSSLSIIKKEDDNNFTINPLNLVLKNFVRVVNYYIGSITVNNRFIRSIMNKLEYDEVNNLLLNLVHEGIVLPILVKNNWIPEIIKKRLKTLSAILECLINSNRNNIEDEDEFIDQIAEYQEDLVERYINIGVSLGHLQINEEYEDDMYNEEKFECENIGSNDKSKEKKIEQGDKKIKNKIEFKEITETETMKQNIKYSMESYTIYKILNTICSNRNKMHIRIFKVNYINRFTLEYIRLVSYNQKIKSNKMMRDLIDLFFKHRENTHLQISIFRILAKTSPITLKYLGFFEKMYAELYTYISLLRGESGKNTFVMDGLFSFLIRLYIRLANFIKSEYTEWETLHALIEPICHMENIKYMEKDLNMLAEYEGFERFIIENMLAVLPCPSIFRADENL